MKDKTISMIQSKLSRTNTIPCPVNKKILISHNSENARCAHESCLFFCSDSNNCSLKSRIFRQEKKKQPKYHFGTFLNQDSS